MTDFERLLAEFSAETGLEATADAKGACSFETDGLIITLQYRSEADDIVIFAPLSDPDAAEGPTPQMLRRALELSYDGKSTGGAFLGLFDGQLVLSSHVPMQDLDANALAAKLSAFADTALAARAEIFAAQPDDAPDASAAPDNSDNTVQMVRV